MSHFVTALSIWHDYAPFRVTNPSRSLRDATCMMNLKPEKARKKQVNIAPKDFRTHCFGNRAVAKFAIVA